MPITADLNIPEEVKPISFGRTLVDWNRQEITIQYAAGKTHIIRMTENQWNYLKNGMQALMSGIPAVLNVTFPKYNPHFWDEPEQP